MGQRTYMATVYMVLPWEPGTAWKALAALAAREGCSCQARAGAAHGPAARAQSSRGRKERAKSRAKGWPMRGHWG